MEQAEIRFADPGAVIAEALDALLPPPRINTADYAAGHRYLTNEGGGYVGRWRHEQVPYLAEPMRELDNRRFATVAIVGPGQVVKTTAAENWLLKNVATSPANMLWYMQSEDGVAAFVKNRIDPLVNAHAEMKARQGLRAIDDSLHFKRFRGMTIEFLSATRGNLISKSAPRIVADEIDAYPESLGDVKALLDIRRQTYAGSKLLAISHPDRAEGLDPARWTAGIMAIYSDSDRRIWYWPCPHCGRWSSPNPWGSRVMGLDYPADASLDEIEREARLVCPVNGCIVTDKERIAINPLGRWIGSGETINEDGVVEGERVASKTAGFWIVGAMSPFAFGGIGGLGRARAKALREHQAARNEKSEETLRGVMSKQWGVPYAPPRQIGSVDAATIAERAEPALPLDTVPAGVRFITVAVDCQLSHFDWMVRGFGVEAESWIIARGRLPGDPATAPEDWDRLFEEVIGKSWPLSDGSGRVMAPRGAGYDMHGQPGVTTQARAAWLRWRRKGVIRKYGRIAGRDAWSVVPTRGVGTIGASRLAVTYPDTAAGRNARGSTAPRGDVPVAQFNSNLFKDDLSGQLSRAQPGPWYVHFPGALKAPKPPHVWFEQLVAERRNDQGQWKKPHNAVRNEALDQMVLSHVVAHLHGLPRLNWAEPPAWADIWDRNPAVTVPLSIDSGTVSAAGAAPVTVEASPAPEPRADAQPQSAPGGWLGPRRKGYLN